MAARRSLKDQLAELSQTAPVDLDPEDALAGIDHPEGNRLSIDDSAAREHYIDVAPSAIRKLHDSVNDSKYDGVRTSRKQLDDFSDYGSISEDQDEGVDAEEDELEHSHSEGATEDDEELESPSEGEEDASGPESEDGVSQLRATALSSPDAPPANTSDSPQENDIASNLRKTHEIDKKKGRAVSRQIALWDTLLDARIQLHKAVTAANRLPLPAEIEQYVAHPAAREALDSFFDIADGLAEELFSLQEDLLRVNESIEPPARKRRRLEAVTEPAREYGEALTALSASASTLEATCHPWLVDTLSKWSAKVQAVAPNVLLPDNKGSFMRNGKAPVHAGVASLIDDVLRSDNAKLLDRTRKRKDKHTRIGHVSVAGDDDERADVDVFDDTDYYQQLLRDVIAARGGGEAQGEQQWQAAQRERKAKRRKTVDTKASKGRKLRYDAHPKLQNFMVPVPVVVGEWHEEQIDGLFSSLLQT